MKPNICMAAKDMKQVAQALTKVLADNTVLYMKTHGFHWNITGPHFKMYHDMFEEQYTDMFEAQDVIAERIRALGELAPNSYKELLKHATMKENMATLSPRDMIEALLDGNEAMIKSIREAMTSAENAGDEGSFDMLVERLQTHEKNAWMLRATLS